MNFPYWLSTLNSQVDLRVTYVSCCGPNDINFCSQFSWPDESQVLNDVSPISGVPVMFTTEALFYAQSGYFVTIVMIQWVNLFCCRSRKVINKGISDKCHILQIE
jgi:sodium/potassium-transporting ATPase subunit alpha